MVGAYKHQVKMYCYGTLQTQSRDESLGLVFCSLDSNLMSGSKVVHTKHIMFIALFLTTNQSKLKR